MRQKVSILLLCFCMTALTACAGKSNTVKDNESGNLSGDKAESGENTVGNGQSDKEGQLKDVNISSVTLTFYEEDPENHTYTYGVTWQTNVHLLKPMVELIPADKDTWENAVRITGAGKDSKYFKTFEIKEGYNYDMIAGEYRGEWPWYLESGITDTHDYVTIYSNKLVISGLTAGQTYKYRVGDANCDEYSSVGTFTAYNSKDEEGEDDKSFNFVFMTDSQQTFGEKAKLAWRTTLEAAFAHMPEAEFMVHGGDLINYNSIEQQWTELLDDNKDYIMNIPIMPAAGNHEVNMVWSGTPIGYDFNNHFNLSYVNEINTTVRMLANGYYGTYYSYDYKNVHFVALNSNEVYANHSAGNGYTLGDMQMEWLKQDLATANERSDIDYTIVYMHHGLYTVGAAGLGKDSHETKELREQLQGVFAEYGVNLVLNGHDHIYSVTKVLDKDGAVAANSNTAGVVYMSGAIAGSNGPGTSYFESGSEGIGTNTADKYDKIINGKAFCWTELRVTSDGIKVTSYTAEDGTPQELDTFTIKKNNVGTTF